MESTNESFVFYQSWFEAAACFGSEKQVEAVMQIIRYGIYGELPDNENDPILKALMISWAPQVDASKKKRRGGAPAGNQNAKGRGAPKGNQNARKTNNKNKQPLNVNENVNDNVDVNDNSHSSVETPAIMEGAGDTTLNEPDWMRDDYEE